MNPILSQNTQAILLLTAPLIAGRGVPTSELLTPGEYKRLARHMREMQRQPADLLSPDAAELLCACQPIIDKGRLQSLLGRGFLLSQAIERWQSRAIWVMSRADTDCYPRRLKVRLREDAPAVLYGCGDITLLETGGLAVVGSRHVDDSLIDYTMSIGRLSAKAGKPVVSGGAKGVDQAAMRGALEAGGKVIGVLADSLEKTAMNREHRNLLLDEQLVLISPYDPNAGFNVGNAMQRNKFIYALADAALVVSSDLNKGGTWAGATEQLDKLKLVPVYVRSTGETGTGLDALCKKGALPWPNPQDEDSFAAIFEKSGQALPGLSTPVGRSLFDTIPAMSVAKTDSATSPPESDMEAPKRPALPIQTPIEILALSPEPLPQQADVTTNPPLDQTPADVLFASVREVLQRLLKTLMKDTEVADVLQVSSSQAKAWLQRLVEEGVLEKKKKPAGYIVKQSGLFE